MKKDKKEITNELIIPEMEPLEDIKIEQTEDIKKEDKKETINVENGISESKPITNSQELLNLLNKSIVSLSFYRRRFYVKKADYNSNFTFGMYTIK